MGSLNLFLAFLAGLASFLSPCCLPLVPSYLLQLVGPGILEAKASHTLTGQGTLVLVPTLRRFTAFWHAAAFVAGFSVIFIALGATASVLGGFLKSHQVVLSEIGGVVLIGLGLHYAGILRIPMLYREGRLHWRPTTRGYPTSFVVGIIYALGWTPCIGVVLTSILVLAAQSGTLAAGIVLLATYSLGLGVPFLLMGPPSRACNRS